MPLTVVVQPLKKQPIRDGLAAAFGYYSRPNGYFGNAPESEALDQGLTITDAFYAITDMGEQGPRSRFVIAEGRYARDNSQNCSLQAYIALQQRAERSKEWAIKEIWTAQHFSSVVENLKGARVLRQDGFGFIGEHPHVNGGVYAPEAYKDLHLHLSPDSVRKAIGILRKSGMTAVSPDDDRIWRFYNPQKPNKAYSLRNIAGDWYVCVDIPQAGKIDKNPVWRRMNTIPLSGFSKSSIRKMPVRHLRLWLNPMRYEFSERATGIDAPDQIALRKKIAASLKPYRDYQRAPDPTVF